jgi:hypothetical protein
MNMDPARKSLIFIDWKPFLSKLGKLAWEFFPAIFKPMRWVGQNKPSELFCRCTKDDARYY